MAHGQVLAELIIFPRPETLRRILRTTTMAMCIAIVSLRPRLYALPTPAQKRDFP